MPALSATNHNDGIKALYQRIVERNPTIKRKGVVAGMRKLLILTFVLWKKRTKHITQITDGIQIDKHRVMRRLSSSFCSGS